MVYSMLRGKEGLWCSFEGSSNVASGRMPSQGFEGMYTAGAKEGHGTFSWSDGSSYTGSFSNNYFHGTGDYRPPDGASKSRVSSLYTPVALLCGVPKIVQ